MARDEMNQIREDRWDEDIWGAATPSLGSPRPKLAFNFGANDHWVDDRTRDKMIALKGRKGEGETWKAKMMIDEDNIPHSFCISEFAEISG